MNSTKQQHAALARTGRQPAARGAEKTDPARKTDPAALWAEYGEGVSFKNAIGLL